HARWVKTAIENNVGIPVVGYLQADDALNLPERHLGLIPTLEAGRWQTWLQTAREKITATVDLDQILRLARSTPPLTTPTDSPFTLTSKTRATIGLARDAAFSFLYEDNLDLLR